jgi:hypothetical protein
VGGGRDPEHGLSTLASFRDFAMTFEACFEGQKEFQIRFRKGSDNSNFWTAKLPRGERGRWMRVELRAEGSRAQVLVDGQPMKLETRGTPLAEGAVYFLVVGGEAEARVRLRNISWRALGTGAGAGTRTE